MCLFTSLFHVLQDKSKNIQFTVLTDRSEGGSSITDGHLEIMVSVVINYV